MTNRNHNNDNISNNYKKTENKKDDKETKKTKEENKSEDILTLKITGFFKKDIVIREAKKYSAKLKDKKNMSDLFTVFSGIDKTTKLVNLMKKNNYDLTVNCNSIKTDKNARIYIQQNSLFLTNSTFLDKELTVRENIKIVSLMYTGYDLSNASLSSFSLSGIADEKVSSLTQEQKNITILSYTVACPAIFWLIDGRITKSLSKANRYIFDNVVNIRTRHGGAVLIIDDNDTF